MTLLHITLVPYLPLTFVYITTEGDHLIAKCTYSPVWIKLGAEYICFIFNLVNEY